MDSSFSAASLLDRDLVAAAVRGRLDAGGPAVVGGLWGSASALYLAYWLAAERGAVLVLAATIDDSEGIGRDLERFGVDARELLPFTPAEGPSEARAVRDAASLARDLRSLRRLRESTGRRVLLAPVLAALAPVPRPDALGDASFTVSVGDRLDRDALAEKFAARGFRRAPVVVTPGEFAVRGDIVDVFPLSEERPIRLELLGDDVESIRRFDPETQRSESSMPSATVALIGEDDAREGRGTVLDYLGPNDLVVLKDPAEIRARVERASGGAPGLAEAFAALAVELGDGLAAEPTSPRRARRRMLSLQSAPALEGDGTWNAHVGAIDSGGPTMAQALETLRGLLTECDRVTVFCQSEAERRRFHEVLEQNRTGGRIEGLDRLDLEVGDLERGFRLPERRRAFLSHHELFHRHQKRRDVPPPAPAYSRPLDDFLELKPGEYVVHTFHGIARYQGLKRIVEHGRTKEFLSLEFSDEVTLYVPVTQVDLVQRYVGVRGHSPALSTLGGKNWSNRKSAVASAVSTLALELLDVAATREKKQGITYPPDSEWQHEFEAAFPFPDTEDQKEATAAIKGDMTSPRPMDRLICGDVGFGKTELAMRAAFKAVDAGKQVGVLVPTTVLAEQHLETFRERFCDYPFVIESISRFRTAKEQRDILERTAAGGVDILIGTHRLVQDDVVFRDLGLVVIDEEQRFGVEAKQKLKRLRATVDVMTLSATPIPRTLHMALLGLRDISSLSTAPVGRQPIETIVQPFDPRRTQDAIRFELARDGQVFFVHNRVETIDRMRQKLQEWVPEARYEVVHGQLPERELESRMLRFTEGEVDVLVTTTIIESGLDIPNANTILINRGDLFGLADLHQLRGRVGRYKKKAYAYVFYPGDRALPTDAEERLRALEQHTELGSGFKIAMRDLEIRGAGNLLGAEQSGHIAAVGYDLYCKLLRDAVKQLRNEPVPPSVEADVDLGVDALLPATYVPDTRQRMEVYRKICQIETDAEAEAVVEELRDRFGAPPTEVRNLVDVARVRAILRPLSVRSVKRQPDRLVVLFSNPRAAEPLLRQSSLEARLVSERTLHLILPDPRASVRDVHALLRKGLQRRGLAV
ncbi:MAG: transcription-repair coupling factor [Planctomycetes bacterium]|nr:transcription-repair coupling factor [Planctomycetota bacterium]MBI3843116.1 transcription-repair coupling factor [Planctomycetota bacterium]